MSDGDGVFRSPIVLDWRLSGASHLGFSVLRICMRAVWPVRICNLVIISEFTDDLGHTEPSYIYHWLVVCIYCFCLSMRWVRVLRVTLQAVSASSLLKRLLLLVLASRV